ncbi:MAG: AAA family ATPase [Deltaproteobacteria bacterium]|nr:AAA family ATPase [Deltaproteobacteria bacterium]
MYLDFYGFRKKPFENTPDPSFFYEARDHKEALAAIWYGVDNDKGLIVIAGEVGTGKTTLVYHYLTEIPSRIIGIYIDYPFESLQELLRLLGKELGLDVEAYWTVSELAVDVRNKLLELYTSGKKVVLIIDESQHLSEKSLEYIRLLSNIQKSEGKLINIVLVGQEELLKKLEKPELRQLRQRIAIQKILRPFSFNETSNYIRHRILLAGSYEMPFTGRALKYIHKRSGGIPRLINALCDNGLLAGYVKNTRKISPRLIKEAIRQSEPGLLNLGKSFRLLHVAGSIVVVLALVFIAKNYSLLPVALKKFSVMKKPSVASNGGFFLMDSDEFLGNPDLQKGFLLSGEFSLADIGLENFATATPIVRFPDYNRANLVKDLKTTWIIKPGDSLYGIIKKVYGKTNNTLLDIILTANPQIENPDVLLVNKKLLLPKIAEDTVILRGPDEQFFMHCCTFMSRETAVLRCRRLADQKFPAKLYGIERNGRIFSMLPRKYLPF